MEPNFTQAPPVVNDTNCTVDDLIGMMGVTHTLVSIAADKSEGILDRMKEPHTHDAAVYYMNQLDELLMAISERQRQESALAIAIKDKMNDEWEATRGRTVWEASTRTIVGETRLEKANGPAWKEVVDQYTDASARAKRMPCEAIIAQATEALHRLLATPAPNHAAALWKMEVINREGYQLNAEAWDGVKLDLAALAATHA